MTHTMKNTDANTIAMDARTEEKEEPMFVEMTCPMGGRAVLCGMDDTSGRKKRRTRKGWRGGCEIDGRHVCDIFARTFRSAVSRCISRMSAHRTLLSSSTPPEIAALGFEAKEPSTPPYDTPEYTLRLKRLPGCELSLRPTRDKRHECQFRSPSRYLPKVTAHTPREAAELCLQKASEDGELASPDDLKNQ